MGAGGAFQISAPSIKDDAVPTVRKAEAREMRWRPSRYNVQPPGEPEQTGCHEGPTILRPPPAGTPAPHLIRFRVLGPPFGGASAEAECDGCGAKPFKIRPLDKDDAAPMGEQSMCRSCGGLGGVYEVTTDLP